MTTTTNLGITLLEQAQAQKEVTINEAITALDALISGAVADKDLSAPPASPTSGVAYIVGPSPTGAWAGKATNIAYFDQIWRFVVPQAGARIWVTDETVFYVFNGTVWNILFTGDMVKAVYDPANIAQQVVGTTAAQTLTNKTINGANNTLTVRAANDITGTLPVNRGGTGQTAFTDGQLLIGNTASGGVNKATLTAGSNVTITNGNGTITIAASGGGGGGLAPMVCEGRLTLTTVTPVTTANVTAATTLYFTPYRGNRIALYDGTSAWATLAFSELSLAVPAVANQMYDVFAYNNAGTAALEATAWTNDTTRATALTRQDGVFVRTGATTRRYLGSFRTIASGQTEDSANNRYMWNYYNRTLRPMSAFDATASWTYSSPAWRQANGNSANQLNFVIGVSEDAVNVALMNSVTNSTATARTVYATVGLDNTAGTPFTFAGSGVIVNNYYNLTNIGTGLVAAGRHYLTWLEYGAGSDVQTWGGGSARGLMGSLLA
ncbi:MAG: DUF2793 domain-containing protein [Rickettsiales bacterium]